MKMDHVLFGRGKKGAVLYLYYITFIADGFCMGKTSRVVGMNHGHFPGWVGEKDKCRNSIIEKLVKSLYIVFIVIVNVVWFLFFFFFFFLSFFFREELPSSSIHPHTESNFP